MSKIKITINNQEIESLDQAIKLIQEAKEKKGLWRPENREKYYALDAGISERFNFIQEATDNHFYENNCFPTESAAQKELDKRKALVRIKDYIAMEFGEWKPNWNDCYQERWEIFYDHRGKNFDTSFLTERQYSEAIPLLKEKSQAIQLIKDCESDLKILFEI